MELLAKGPHCHPQGTKFSCVDMRSGGGGEGESGECSCPLQEVCWLPWGGPPPGQEDRGNHTFWQLPSWESLLGRALERKMLEEGGNKAPSLAPVTPAPVGPWTFPSRQPWGDSGHPLTVGK